MINKAIIVGNVGADPEIRTLESGVKVCRVRVATTERVRKDDGWGDHTEWHTVVLWRGLADVADRYVRKGSQIYVEGPMRSNEWTDKEGNKRRSAEVVADNVYFADSKREGDGGYAAPVSGYGSAPSGYTAPAEGDQFAELSSDDGELPF